jgi:hypothetical protein
MAKEVVDLAVWHSGNMHVIEVTQSDFIVVSLLILTGAKEFQMALQTG